MQDQSTIFAGDIWSINKDPTIKAVLLQLDMSFNSSNYIVDLGHDKNLNSVYIRDISCPDLSAYIYSYAQNANHYGVELEQKDDAGAINIESYDELNVHRVLDLVSAHLNLF